MQELSEHRGRGFTPRCGTRPFLGWVLLLGSCVGGCEAPEARRGVLPLCFGETLEGILGGAQRHSYEFELEHGQFHRVVVDQKGIDLVVELRSRGNQLLARVDSPNRDKGPETVTAIGVVNGDWLRVDLSPLDPSSRPGGYSIRIEESRSASSEDRLFVLGERAFSAAEILAREDTRDASVGALEQYEEAIESWRQLPAGQALGWALHQAGKTAARRGLWKKALSYYCESLEFYSSAGSADQHALLESRVGWAYLKLDRPIASVEHFRRSRALYQALDDRVGVATTLKNLGAAFIAMGQQREALAVYRQSLDHLIALGDEHREASVRVDIGYLWLQLHRRALAADEFERALEIYRGAENPRREATALKALADVAYAEDDLERALALVNESLDLRARFGNPHRVAVALNSKGNILWKTGMFQEAEAAYREALGLLQPRGTDRDVGWVALDLARLRNAAGDADEALDLYELALRSFEAAGDLRGQAASRMGMVRVLRSLAKHSEALEQIRQSVAATEELRRASPLPSGAMAYRAFRQEYYELQVEVLQSLARETQDREYEVAALEVVERYRARGLTEALIGATAKSSAIPPVEVSRLGKQRDELRRRIEDLVAVNSRHWTDLTSTTLLRSALQELEEVESELSRFGAPSAVSAEISVNEIQNAISKQETLLLVYALGSERSFLWALSGDNLESHVLPSAAELERLAGICSQSFQKVSGREDARSRRARQKLSELLLGPVKERLKGQRLLIMADGALHLLPFAALSVPAREGKLESPGRYLVEEHEIVYLPSISVLRLLRERNRQTPLPPKSLAVFADPVLDHWDPRLINGVSLLSAGPEGLLPESRKRPVHDPPVGDLPRIPFTRQEAATIVGLNPRRDSWLATGFSANRERVLNGGLDQYRILHFATHGILHRRHPELSGLVLSLVDEQGTLQEGFLRSHEIAGLSLPAELVVLSGCQTASGKEFRGEGLVGLAHSFFSAGVSRLVVSLWNVGDRSTRELMERFYRGLLVQGLSPSAALRDAQVSMLRSKHWSQPNHWAGFIFQGEWRPIGEGR